MHPIDAQELYDAYHPKTYSRLCDEMAFFAPFENEQRRTLYFGNLPQTISFHTFLNHIAGGIIDHVKILHDKQCAFVTFLNNDDAQAFHDETKNKRFVIQGYDVRVGKQI
jgi:hypothetical protein